MHRQDWRFGRATTVAVVRSTLVTVAVGFSIWLLVWMPDLPPEERAIPATGSVVGMVVGASAGTVVAWVQRWTHPWVTWVKSWTLVLAWAWGLGSMWLGAMAWTLPGYLESLTVVLILAVIQGSTFGLIQQTGLTAWWPETHYAGASHALFMPLGLFLSKNYVSTPWVWILGGALSGLASMVVILTFLRAYHVRVANTFAVGTVRHPVTGRYQTWVVLGGTDISYLTAHTTAEAAQRVAAGYKVGTLWGDLGLEHGDPAAYLRQMIAASDGGAPQLLPEAMVHEIGPAITAQYSIQTEGGYLPRKR